MKQDPMYNIFRYSFLRSGVDEGNDQGYFGGRPAEEYANTIVEHLMELSTSSRIETEAALVLNVWMAVIHELYNIVRGCETTQDKVQAQESLDRAVAMYVGAMQTTGSNEHGSLLYNLAEIAGERFGQDNGETIINRKVLGIFVSLQENLSNELSCLPGFENTVVRESVEELIALMTVPLVQSLIHHIINVQHDGKSSDLIDLYALSIAPRVVSCNPNLNDFIPRMSVEETSTLDEKMEAIKTLQGVYSCLKISCEHVGGYEGDVIVPQCDDEPALDEEEPMSLAGYTTPRRSSVQLASYIDRDILQMRILLESQAYEAALDMYKFGYNSGHSLQKLALNQAIPSAKSSMSLFDTFQDYYNTESYTFADSTILAALTRKVAPYDEASPKQITHLVVGLLKYVVMQLSMVSSLQFAVDQCIDKKRDSSLEYWDQGAAYYIGSIQGSSQNGEAQDSVGILLYATAKELCSQFGTCSPITNDAVVNVAIVDALKEGLQSLEEKDCNAANTTLNEIIMREALPVPLIQGTLLYASVNDRLLAASEEGSLATGSAFSQSVLPYLNLVDERSAELIQRNMELQFDSHPVADGFDDVADAMSNALRKLSLECGSVGSIGGRDMCPPDDWVAPDNDLNPGNTSLSSRVGFGRYQFTSENAEVYARLAFDVRDMVRGNSIDDARVTYRYGYNAHRMDSSEVVHALDLASFSTKAARTMSQDPTFNIFKYALYDESILEGDHDFTYADEVVMEALERASDQELAADAVVALNVWMMIAHKLHDSVRLCKNGFSPEEVVDEAVALWIGEDQEEGSFENGWMLYSVAQGAAMHFGRDEGEASVNAELMKQFNEMQQVGQGCFAEPEMYLDLRLKVSEILRLLSIPLLQQLLYCIAADDRWHVELYAIAVVSQFVAYHPVAYMELSEILYSGFSREHVDDKVIGHLATFMAYMRMSCEDIITTDSAIPYLQELTRNICYAMDQNRQIVSIKGYVPSTEVKEEARIDLDIRQIGIFIRTNAREAALDYYLNGYNSIAGLPSVEAEMIKNVRTLNAFATLETRWQSLDFSIFSSYYGSDTYADDLILRTLGEDSFFGSSTAGQLAAVVTTVLQTIVSYRAILTKLQASVTMCKQSLDSEAETEWDGAVGWFVGSIEMAYPEIHPNGGQLLYSLGLQQCQFFGTCQDTGEAINNMAILKQFTHGKGLIKDGSCDLAESMIENSIAPSLQVLIVQGILQHAIENESIGEEGTGESLASAFILSKAIEPLVNRTDPANARTLASNFVFPTSNVPIPGAGAIFDVFRDALGGLAIDCKDVGQPLSRPDLSVCSENAQDEGDPTVGVQVYVPTTDVQQQANLALDIAEMARALLDGLSDEAKLIYEDGKNSVVFDDHGQPIKLRTLRGLSVNATLDMLDDPLFNIFMYAHQEGFSGSGLRKVDGRRRFLKASEYANYVVESILNSEELSASTLASEASIALNVWMYVVHLLYKILSGCRHQQFDGTDGVHAVDEVVAYWIGDGQGFRETQGHLLYGMTEVMGQLFGTLDQGQSRANRKILSLFNEAKAEIAMPKSCTNNAASSAQMHSIVNNIISLMTVPLVQALIHNIYVQDKNRVALYAHAFVPMTAGCSTETYELLRDNLMDANFDSMESEKIIARIFETFPCLGIRCEDVGVYYSDFNIEMPRTLCKNLSAQNPLAGYQPASDVSEVSNFAVTTAIYLRLFFPKLLQIPLYLSFQFAQLDLDLLEIDILMEMDAFEAAQDIYLYGKHADLTSRSGASLSLSQVAKATERTDIPTFRTFQQYYQSDSYANQFIVDIIAGTDDRFHNSERRIATVRACQVLASYIGVISALHDASSECESDLEVAHSWDIAAAFFIGHLEGPNNGGSPHNGYFLYDLAQEHCKEFGTCTSDHTAVVNEKLVTLLYAGRGAAKSRSCGALRKAGTEIQTASLIPLIQATLSASLRLSKKGYDRLDVVRGHAYSRAILPLVAKVDSFAAKVIDETFDLNERHLPINEQVVFAAFSRVYNALGVNCRHVGQASGLDACQNFDNVKFDGYHGERKRGLSKASIGIITITGIILISLLLIFRMESRKRRNVLKDSVNKEESTSFLSKTNSFAGKSTLLSAEAVRLTTSLRFSEHKEANADDDDCSDATIVTSNVDTREPDII